MANVILLKSQLGAPVHVMPIPMITYGPYMLCLATYNEYHVPQMKDAAIDFHKYIIECYKKQGRPKRKIVIPN